MPASPKTAIRPETKHARIVAMLRSSAGATIAAITVATGWQQHSVRGFLPGWSARSLDLILCLNGLKGRVYRIKDGKASPATAADRRNAGGVI
jgi:hypothetical protein